MALWAIRDGVKGALKGVVVIFSLFSFANESVDCLLECVGRGGFGGEFFSLCVGGVCVMCVCVMCVCNV